MRLRVKIWKQTRHFFILLTALCALNLGFGASALAESSLYGYGKAKEGALALYRQGWAEILENGRWTEAERLYREAVAADPDFIIAKSVLARITADPVERKALMSDLQQELESVDAPGRLVLDPYVKTLALISAREMGQSLSEEFRSDLTQLAIANYRSFLESYPDEWAVRIEYIEWIHAQQGPEAALGKIREMRDENLAYVSRLSYFPAYFHAELGDYDRAAAVAEEFVNQLGPGDWPQTHYIAAFIAYAQGNYAGAGQSIQRALQLDPRHLIAQRLSKKISKTLADEKLSFGSSENPPGGGDSLRSAVSCLLARSSRQPRCYTIAGL